MKIRRIWLKDVGPFKELDIEIPAGIRPDRADVVVITGPNGSGKTTLLYALATALNDTDQLGRRWGANGQVVLETADQTELQEGTSICGTGKGSEKWIGQFRPDIGPTQDFEQLPWFREDSDTQLQAESLRVSIFSAGGLTWWKRGPMGDRWPKANSLFAYDAFRRLDSTAQLVIGEQVHDEPETGGRFGKSVVTGSFETWIANTRTKIALAREDGDDIAVRRYERTLGTVEQTISELTGEVFSLRVSREPLEVLGGFNGLSAPLSMLPDGLRSSLAWLGDVLRRLDQMERPEGSDPLQLPIVVLLDEIDAHLHPEWQRKILYVAERLLPNAQLIVSTHSPFVVQSATDACIIKLGAHGESVEVVGPQSGSTFDAVLEDILGVRGDSFSVEIEAQLDTFKQQRNEVLQGELAYEVLEARAKELAALSESLDLSLQRHLVDVKARIGAA